MSYKKCVQHWWQQHGESMNIRFLKLRAFLKAQQAAIIHCVYHSLPWVLPSSKSQHSDSSKGLMLLYNISALRMLMEFCSCFKTCA